MDTVPKIFRPIYDYLTNSCNFATINQKSPVAGLIEKFAESVQSPIPALRVVEKNLESAVALGYGNENASALIKSLEKSAGVEVKTGRAGRSKATKQND